MPLLPRLLPLLIARGLWFRLVVLLALVALVHGLRLPVAVNPLVSIPPKWPLLLTLASCARVATLLRVIGVLFPSSRHRSKTYLLAGARALGAGLVMSFMWPWVPLFVFMLLRDMYRTTHHFPLFLVAIPRIMVRALLATAVIPGHFRGLA